MLESLVCLLKFEWPPEELVDPRSCDDGIFQYVRGGHQNLMVAWDQIDFRENACSSEMGRKVLFVGYWVSVGYSGIVKAPVIPTRVPATPDAFSTNCRGEAHWLAKR